MAGGDDPGVDGLEQVPAAYRVGRQRRAAGFHAYQGVADGFVVDLTAAETHRGNVCPWGQPGAPDHRVVRGVVAQAMAAPSSASR
jgi:hypothetical protein